MSSHISNQLYVLLHDNDKLHSEQKGKRKEDRANLSGETIKSVNKIGGNGNDLAFNFSRGTKCATKPITTDVYADGCLP